jgi:cytochrome d ubiquinol oxidase subunit I
MGGAVVTGAFVMAATGAFYLLKREHEDLGRVFLRVGVIAACAASVWQLFPTGDQQGQLIARHQPVTLAAMEGLFKTEQGASMVILGQPNTAEQRIDNPITIPGALSFITYRRWGAEVKGLDAFPEDQRPGNIPLLYYSYHIMVGLGTIFIAIMGIALSLLARRRLYEARWMLWIIMLSFPFPFIANTAGWTTAELGRQPWLVYGLMRTVDGTSAHVSAGNGLFSLIGFMGMYTILSILYLFLIWREVEHGPQAVSSAVVAPPVPDGLVS